MLREKGDLFLPFEQRITRDYTGLRQAFASRRARRHARGKSTDLDLDVPVADTLPAHTVKGWSGRVMHLTLSMLIRLSLPSPPTPGLLPTSSCLTSAAWSHSILPSHLQPGAWHLLHGSTRSSPELLSECSPGTCNQIMQGSGPSFLSGPHSQGQLRLP